MLTNVSIIYTQNPLKDNTKYQTFSQIQHEKNCRHFCIQTAPPPPPHTHTPNPTPQLQPLSPPWIYFIQQWLQSALVELTYHAHNSIG